MLAMLFQEYQGLILNLFKLNCKVVWLAFCDISISLPFWSQIFILYSPFPYFCLVTISACWTFRLHLLKENKRERKKKKKRFFLLTMLVAFLFLSWRLISIFWHGNMKWWIQMKHIVPCLWIGQSTPPTSLGLIWCVLEFFLVPSPYFSLAYWMAPNLVVLCFRLMMNLWRKLCKWSEASNCWLVLSLLNMWSMKRVRYAMMLSECFLLGLFLDNGPNTWLCWLFRWVE